MTSADLEPYLPSIAASEALLERARGLIPGATQTLAKGPGQFVRGVAPVFLERGAGCRVFDVDGNEYIDLSMGVGPISLGYAYEPVDRAIREQLASGITFSLPHRLEVEVAEQLRALVPHVERVRFSKTGADATSAAVRLARAFTGRDRVLACGYHGWHDWYLGVTDRARGVPAATRDLINTFTYGDLDHLERSLDETVACVILEPVVFEAPPPGWLHDVKRVVSKRGALLVFDEMWTGFRIALGGAQEYFDVAADLVTFSKAIANGMPLSVLAGRADVMALLEREVFFYTTFGGEVLSLAAARATLTELQRLAVPAHVAKQGRRLRDGFNDLADRHGADFVRAVGLDFRTMVRVDDVGDATSLELKSLLQQEMLRRGVLWTGVHNLSASHGDHDVARVLDAYEGALRSLVSAVRAGAVRARLEGAPIEPVFRRTHHFNTKPRVRG